MGADGFYKGELRPLELYPWHCLTVALRGDEEVAANGVTKLLQGGGAGDPCYVTLSP